MHFKSLQTFKGQLVGVQDWPDAVCAGQMPSASPLRKTVRGSLLTEFLSSLAVLPAAVSFRMFYKPNRFHPVMYYLLFKEIYITFKLSFAQYQPWWIGHSQ